MCQTCNNVNCSCTYKSNYNINGKTSTKDEQHKTHCSRNTPHNNLTETIDNDSIFESETVSDTSENYFELSTICNDEHNNNIMFYNDTTVSRNTVDTSMSAQNLLDINLGKKGMHIGHINSQGLQNKLEQIVLC